MPNDEPWIDERLQECKNAHESVTNSAVALLKALLEGELSDRPLTQSELTVTAVQLMAEMSKLIAPQMEIRHAD